MLTGAPVQFMSKRHLGVGPGCIKVGEKGKIGYVPLGDLRVTPKTDKNYWPVREYVVWFANRC